jgi:hypothetical protein
MIALDTETTGKDFHHGCKPFFVTICDENGDVSFWEWDVDPNTREPHIPPLDISQIRQELSIVSGWGDGFDEEIRERHALVGQNTKFDAHALATIGVSKWPWHMTHDTLMAGHLLASNRPHDLTSMGIQYLGVDISKYEEKLKEHCLAARRAVKSLDLPWRVAKDGDPNLPSVKGDSAWRNDYWLPRALVKHLWQTSVAGQAFSAWEATGVLPGALASGVLDADEASIALQSLAGWEYAPPELTIDPHPWWTALREYANADSPTTLALWVRMRDELHRRGLWAIYKERMKVLPIASRMEGRGITVDAKKLDKLLSDYREESLAAERLCVGIAEGYGYNLQLPKSGMNKSLKEFCFGGDAPHGVPPRTDSLNLPPVSRTEKTGEPGLDKLALEHYESTLPPRSKARVFVSTLKAKRKRDTAITYMEGYRGRRAGAGVQPPQRPAVLRQLPPRRL